MPLSLAEDPFNPETDANKPPRVRGTFAIRSAQFYGHGGTPPLVSGRFYDGKNHMPLRSPTNMLWFSSSNSLLGNARGHWEEG